MHRQRPQPISQPPILRQFVINPIILDKQRGILELRLASGFGTRPPLRLDLSQFFLDLGSYLGSRAQEVRENAFVAAELVVEFAAESPAAGGAGGEGWVGAATFESSYTHPNLRRSYDLQHFALRNMIFHPTKPNISSPSHDNPGFNTEHPAPVARFSGHREHHAAYPTALKSSI
ncbi:hypothetical protein V499_03949 [Pseudogymnoascus sp. VKM F-103]|nr:hypothetical protein V499_03949 [Pseudogymnoascus sp. VKM F-103]